MGVHSRAEVNRRVADIYALVVDGLPLAAVRSLCGCKLQLVRLRSHPLPLHRPGARADDGAVEAGQKGGLRRVARA